MRVIKKNGTEQEFDISKVIKAVSKSADRCMHKFTKSEIQQIENSVLAMASKYTAENETDKIPISVMHNFAELALEQIDPAISDSYKSYRNYKIEFADMLDSVYKKSQTIRYIGDVSNANTDSAMISTQRSLIYGQLNKELYQKFFLNKEELQAAEDGYIYIHDMKDRLDGFNCFTRETKFITSSGVRSFYDFHNGDKVTVLTHTGEWKPATVHKLGEQKTQKVTFAFGNDRYCNISVDCTPDHRWILKDGSITTNLKVGDKLWQIPKFSSFDWDSLTMEEKKLWCRGFALINGHKDSSLNNDNYILIYLHGKSLKYLDRFKSCGYVTNNMADIYTTVSMVNLDKEVPFYELDYTNIKYYIDGILCALKYTEKAILNHEFKYVRMLFSDKCIEHYMSDMLNMTGYFIVDTKYTNNLITGRDNTVDYYVATQHDLGWKVINIEPSSIKSEVWCLDVEDNHSFVLEGGIPTGNCQLFDMANVLSGGFEMGNQWYTEPKTLDVAFDVISDITISAASQQYGK